MEEDGKDGGGGVPSPRETSKYALRRREKRSLVPDGAGESWKDTVRWVGHKDEHEGKMRFKTINPSHAITLGAF